MNAEIALECFATRMNFFQMRARRRGATVVAAKIDKALFAFEDGRSFRPTKTKTERKILMDDRLQRRRDNGSAAMTLQWRTRCNRFVARKTTRVVLGGHALR